MILYVENPKDSTKNKINFYSKKINKINLVLHISSLILNKKYKDVAISNIKLMIKNLILF